MKHTDDSIWAKFDNEIMAHLRRHQLVMHRNSTTHTFQALPWRMLLPGKKTTRDQTHSFRKYSGCEIVPSNFTIKNLKEKFAKDVDLETQCKLIFIGKYTLFSFQMPLFDNVIHKLRVTSRSSVQFPLSCKALVRASIDASLHELCPWMRSGPPQ